MLLVFVKCNGERSQASLLKMKECSRSKAAVDCDYKRETKEDQKNLKEKKGKPVRAPVVIWPISTL